MAETYSLAILGYSTAQQPMFATASKNLTVGDSGASAEQYNMRLNTQILCKNQDGSQSWYTYDAERSIPGVLRVMKKVT
jgi:hypothetical protein